MAAPGGPLDYGVPFQLDTKVPGPKEEGCASSGKENGLLSKRSVDVAFVLGIKWNEPHRMLTKYQEELPSGNAKERRGSWGCEHHVWLEADSGLWSTCPQTGSFKSAESDGQGRYSRRKGQDLQGEEGAG